MTFLLNIFRLLFFYCFAVIYLLHTINTTAAAAAAAAIFNEIIPIFPSDSLQNQWGFKKILAGLIDSSS